MLKNFSKIIAAGLICVGFNVHASSLDTDHKLNNKVEFSFMDDSELANVQAANRWNSTPETVQAKLPPVNNSKNTIGKGAAITEKQLAKKIARQKAKQEIFKNAVKGVGAVFAVVATAAMNIAEDSKNLQPYKPGNNQIVFH
ncbi:MAG: hypothetical protein ACK5Q1_10865 [Limnobacter sp.]|jgi:hypothetical protein